MLAWHRSQLGRQLRLWLTVAVTWPDIYPGAPRRSIVLDEARIVNKIVRERRGGFCYELNSGFGWLLRQLGFTVERLSARMNTIMPDVFGPPFDHLCLRVNSTWLCDVTASYAMGPLELRTTGQQPQRSHGVLFRLAECVLPQPPARECSTQTVSP
eukprot:COSAG02_NODE_3296_length_6994_cov_6.368528_2_plen_156_part_00